jgi:hypothetical protein
MKITAIAAAIAGFLYLIFHASKTAAANKPILVTPSTQVSVTPGSFFGSPSPVIARSTLVTPGVTTGPTYQQANILPLTPSSPSLLVPLAGNPGVGGGGVSDINSAIDYPGIQSYMSDPNAPDPNVVMA